jgi:nitroreductase
MADLTDSIRTRRSIRKFTDDQVPEGVIREILAEARWSPSWGNTQQWEVIVLRGQALETFKKINQRRVLDGVMPNPDIAMPQVWPEPFAQRYMDMGKSIFTALDIARDDSEARNRFTIDMFGLFDAPCLLLLCIDKRLPFPYACLDVGMFLQTVCLAACGRGLGTCIMAAAVSYPEVIREMLPAAENKRFVIGCLLGYPDTEASVNASPRERADPDEYVTWVK